MFVMFCFFSSFRAASFFLLYTHHRPSLTNNEASNWRSQQILEKRDTLSLKYVNEGTARKLPAPIMMSRVKIQFLIQLSISRRGVKSV